VLPSGHYVADYFDVREHRVTKGSARAIIVS
jgi:hypothetical protein